MTHIKSRITREKKIVELMIRLYCKSKEGHKELCPECQALLEYAHTRLDRCPFGEKKTIVLLPETEKILEQMGLQIKYARLRRKLTSELVAERAGISRATLVSIEKGSPSVAMGCYAAVLHALNYMDKDLLLVAKDDELGRKLQDLDLPVRKRAPRRG